MAGRSKRSSGTKKASKKSSTKKSTTKKSTTKYKSLTSFSKSKKSTSKSTTKKTTSKKSSTKKTSTKKSTQRKPWQIIPGKSMKEIKKLLKGKKPKKEVVIKNNNRWHAKGKKSKIIAPVKYQSGTSHKKRDASRQALPPGWRISSVTGEPYFENRQNRSDLYNGI